MPASFASLSASLLARKGEAKPSQEPTFGSKPWQPPVVPAAVIPVPGVYPNAAGWPQAAPSAPVTASSIAPVASIADALPSLPSSARPSVPGSAIADMKVKLQDVVSTWPPAKQAITGDNDGSGWVANRHAPISAFGQPVKTSIRLTHAQARAVKLAALVLDKPQQEILTAGLLDRLEALACADLSSCTCFKAVIEGLKTADPLVEAPLAY